ncbi:MAG: hypothetical protein SF172_09070 [Burkholderiales bacterium]|nr:hypothetical protein [Burkholderiales bacterium]
MSTPLLELKNLKIAYGGINAIKGSRQAGSRGPDCGDAPRAVAKGCPVSA